MRPCPVPVQRCMGCLPRRRKRIRRLSGYVPAGMRRWQRRRFRCGLPAKGGLRRGIFGLVGRRLGRGWTGLGQCQGGAVIVIDGRQFLLVGRGPPRPGVALDGGLGLASAALAALGGRLVVTALAELAPFGEVVGALLLHVGLAVFARDPGNVLFDGILDSDVPDLFVQWRQRIGPKKG